MSSNLASTYKGHVPSYSGWTIEACTVISPPDNKGIEAMDLKNMLSVAILCILHADKQEFKQTQI